MNIPERLRTVPQNVYVIGFLGVFVISLLFAYFTMEDTRLLEKKIQSRQKEYAEVLRLREIYEAKKHAAEKAGGQGEKHPMTLASVEELAGKSFFGGTLSNLRPVTDRMGRGAGSMAVEIKVTNAPLGEVISFVRNAEGFGFYVGKLHLSLSSAGTGGLNVEATVTEKR